MSNVQCHNMCLSSLCYTINSHLSNNTANIKNLLLAVFIVFVVYGFAWPKKVKTYLHTAVGVIIH